jgi:hypothetical protein
MLNFKNHSEIAKKKKSNGKIIFIFILEKKKRIIFIDHCTVIDQFKE